MPQYERLFRWRRVAPLLVVAGFVVVSAHSRIVSAGPRSGGEAGSQLDQALAAVASGDDLTSFVEDGVSIHLYYAGSRRLVTVAVSDDSGRCLLARSSQPGYVEYASLGHGECSAGEAAASTLEWLVKSSDAWQ